MSEKFWMTGLVPATFTPMHQDGSLNLAQTAPIVERLVKHKIQSIFVCGTTGEGSSLSTAERKATLEAYVTASKGRIAAVAHVGHTALADACDLAAHAQSIGAAAVSALPPFYMRPANVSELVDNMAAIAAAAPKLPFYYYHIPGLSGVTLDMVEFLKQAGTRIPNLAGIKYTAPTLYEFQSCAALEGGRYNMVFGVDEMLLSGIASGAVGAVGSTYNLAPALYHQIQAAFAQGDHAQAQRLQLLSAHMVEAVKKFRPLPALKSMMKLTGIDCGPTRLPLVAMRDAEFNALSKNLDALGFPQWMA
ncbi:dihydrodipicolinate synthase family protein [Rhodoferax aquaticus]|uniref:N-acetylneuraminate lyase n=1 Tax=Rhodoferax aquaticus TaxID=2527691 RepID=A0A515ER51_9BURK|nr:dihydrodipicolinate synthase family protein [Rhodoferax aquaticus]QDL55103.1 hypothetical protein EXZ61_13510 [Rhodoferax aquaticus]